MVSIETAAQISNHPDPWETEEPLRGPLRIRSQKDINIKARAMIVRAIGFDKSKRNARRNYQNSLQNVLLAVSPYPQIRQ